MSARGLCRDCGIGSMERNADQLERHAGPYFDHWRRRCAAAFGVFLATPPEPAARLDPYAFSDGDDSPA